MRRSSSGSSRVEYPMRLPIGVQSFEKLREDNYIYIDKTMQIAPLLAGGMYFLSRPRRFGKSLFLSTVRAIFEGRKDLFKGLWLFPNHDFKPRPVIRMDFSNINFTSKSLDDGVLDWLRIQATDYGYQLQATNAKDGLRELVLELSKTAKVVVLIDEYDKPLTDYLLEPEKRLQHQKTLKSVYGVLKPLDEFLHLVVLTGVSKFGKLSLFSDLNNLQDLSLNPDFAQLCGYNKEEIQSSFTPYLEQVAQNLGILMPELWDAIKYWYNGYSWDAMARMYCPFSFLLFLTQKQFKSYWYETGTPTLLLELVRGNQLNPFVFEHLLLSEESIVSADIDHLDALSLMFQTGYLTIKSLKTSPLGTRYELAYPNEEVRQAFSKNLLGEYSHSVPSTIGTFSLELQDALLDLDWNKFFAVANRIFAGIPYEIFPKREDYIHSLMHLMLVSSGWRTQSQVQTSNGRMDTLLETYTHSIIFEFKIKGTAKNALKQIDTNRYAESISKTVVQVGVIFSLEKKQISSWAIG